MVREEFVIKVGAKLRKVIDIQKEQIREATYHSVNPSDYEAGEIIAKKILKEI